MTEKQVQAVCLAQELLENLKSITEGTSHPVVSFQLQRDVCAMKHEGLFYSIPSLAELSTILEDEIDKGSEFWWDVTIESKTVFV